MSSISTATLDQIPVLRPDDVLAEFAPGKNEPVAFRRVLWISYLLRQVALFDLVPDAKLKEPYFRDLDEVEQLIRTGRYSKTHYILPEYMYLADEEIPPKHRKKRDKHWAMIEELFAPGLEPEIYLRSARGPRVTKIAKANRKTRRIVLTLLYRSYKNGRIPNGVLPKWPNCGRPGEFREPGKVKRGRKPKVVQTGHAPERVGVNVDEEMRKNLLLGVDMFCGSDDRVSLAKAYRDTRDRFFVELKEERNGAIVTVPMPNHLVPTEGQFRYYAKQRRMSEEFVRKRLGERNYLLTSRALTGTARSGLVGPGHLFEIDSTIADVYLVSRYNPTWVIGRPVIYVVIDTFSRLIVGLYIGLIGPSWEGARLAVANALSNKARFCERHGIPFVETEWPAYHFPYAIAADRGELLSAAAEAAFKSLRITLSTPGPYRADWKGVVERRFRILNDETIDWLPGAVRQRQRDMRRRGCVLDAALNIEEFTHVIVNCVREHNLYVRRDDLLTKEMIASGVEPYSVDMWNWGVANITGPLRSEDTDLVRTHLLPSAEATVTERGILCKGMPYACERAVAEGWFERARRYGSWRVPVRTEYLTNTIYLAPPAVPRFEECQLLDPEERYVNMRVEEAVDCLEYLRLSGTDLSDRDERGRHALRQQCDSTIQSALSRKKETRKLPSPKSDTSQIRKHRALETHAERVMESHTQPPKSADVVPLRGSRTAPTAPNSPAISAEMLNILSAQRNKKWEAPT